MRSLDETCLIAKHAASKEPFRDPSNTLQILDLISEKEISKMEILNACAGEEFFDLFYTTSPCTMNPAAEPLLAFLKVLQTQQLLAYEKLEQDINCLHLWATELFKLFKKHAPNHTKEISLEYIKLISDIQQRPDTYPNLAGYINKYSTSIDSTLNSLRSLYPDIDHIIATQEKRPAQSRSPSI